MGRPMSACIVCGKPATAPYQRVRYFEGQWLAVSDGPPACAPSCVALHSLDSNDVGGQHHQWLLAGCRGPYPLSPVERDAASCQMRAALMGSTP